MGEPIADLSQRPDWHGRRRSTTAEDIPLLPGLEKILLQTPAEQRKGWIFNPESLQGTVGRQSGGRPLAEWVGKIVCRIGKKAGIVVVSKNEKSGKPEKFASAHDLRRSCAQRLLDAGVPPLVISRVLRHASWETTRKYYVQEDVQKDGEAIRTALDLFSQDQGVSQ